MTESERLDAFSENLLQEVFIEADSEEEGSFRLNAFTRIAGEYLIDAGEVSDLIVCYRKHTGMQCNGYDIHDDDTGVDIFISLFTPQCPPATTPKGQIEVACRQAETVLKKALQGYHTSLEESSEAYDMFQRIYELRNKLERARIFVLTNGKAGITSVPMESIGNISVSSQVWDIVRLFRYATSGQRFEPIEIDFEKEFGRSLACLQMEDEVDYRGFLAIVPGSVLVKIYDLYRQRLLERNVRSFLQVRGNVNKGIRDTVKEEPHMFFAYNNGISATADFIDFAVGSDGGVRIKKVSNLQIVNGGQTTATLHHVATKDKADVTNVNVQAKISVIHPDHVEKVVPLISRYANSQNKVNDADFYANDPFHTRMEELSRAIWTPSDSTGRQSQWFYERARGQYLDAKAKERTPAAKRQFEARSPSSQKFTKTDLAKYENTWGQLPYLVSLGAQKNFNHFTVRLKERGAVKPEQAYFERLVAKAIMFKKAERIVSDQKFGGYRANIVTYTLGWLSHLTAQRINLDAIWKAQGITPALAEEISKLSHIVHRVITSPPNQRNITEWCKSKKCWEALCEESFELSSSLQKELHATGQAHIAVADKGIDNPSPEEEVLIEEIAAVPANQWFRIAKWAKETDNLQSWQRSIAFSIGKVVNSGRKPSHKQAVQGKKILEVASSLGFKL